MGSFGANPPPGMAWQIGKTAATIRFVNEAEASFLNRDMTPTELYQLKAMIDRLKDGTEGLEDWDTVDTWLERLRDHYP